MRAAGRTALMRVCENIVLGRRWEDGGKDWRSLVLEGFRGLWLVR
jgi:hypothetical protein